jgi:hypothetical protein
MTILLQLRLRVSPGNEEFHPQPELSSRPEESSACGPLKVMKKAFCPRPLSHGSATLTFVISTEGDEKNAFCPRPLSRGSAALTFVISTEAQRSGEISVLTPLPGNVCRP